MQIKEEIHSLNLVDWEEFKCLLKPHPTCEGALEVIHCYVTKGGGSNKFTWQEGKKLMADRTKWKSTMQDFQLENSFNYKAQNKAKEYLSKYTHDQVGAVSLAASKFYKWIEIVFKFNEDTKGL